jgi:hypothetical protein
VGAVSADAIPSCECSRYDDLANIPMGFDGEDERFFATVVRILDHGGSQWWLYLSRCDRCHQHWMIAQDERIFDEYLLKRFGVSEAESIRLNRKWPTDFMRYEDVLRELGKRCRFPIWMDLNESPLAHTIKEIREVNPALSLAEAASLVGLDRVQLAKLEF